ncbi:MULTISPECIES: hypothetical protein [unclassified Variovorax]|uniref:hypothetical protein n=1 Tax=unclassified Variovorax TaxID=663243 RepID=UPI0011AF1678|nr:MULTISPECIES: hypothetical protein [unclassified Variovorax]
MAKYCTFDLPFARDAAAVDWAAYTDLIGPNIGAVMARVSWNYAGMLARVDAFLPELSASRRSCAARMVGSGWAGPIRSKGGCRGINVSYGVGSGHRGAGLGRLLAYCAVAECMAHQVLAGAPLPTFVNTQARATNAASLAVARSLGVPACPEAGFVVPEDGHQVEYLGFREPVEHFLARGLDCAVDRLAGYDPGAMAAARIGIVADEGEDLDLLGLLEGSTACVEHARP